MKDETEESFATGQARYKVPAHSPAPPVVLGSAVRESRSGSPALRTPQRERDRDENGAAGRIADAEVIATAR